MKPNLVIFDGSNFYHGIKRISPKTHLTGFKYRKLIEIITDTKNNKIEYCVGEVKYNNRSEKVKRLFASQQKLFFNLEQQEIEIKKGYMLKTNGVYREKGVDVRIALDILRGALKNEYNRCFVISSDTDLIPAIQDAQTEDKKVIYVGFGDNLSFALRAVCSQTIIISRQTISRCAK
ncbi:MAG: NYN domain-containing protein [Candidatus Berkelbacteria bacterium]|nr:NYN domain-containing protein [Candidatus Berkelbacteria bacterium]